MVSQSLRCFLCHMNFLCLSETNSKETWRLAAAEMCTHTMWSAATHYREHAVSGRHLPLKENLGLNDIGAEATLGWLLHCKIKFVVLLQTHIVCAYWIL